jgi:hypothetical protein
MEQETTLQELQEKLKALKPVLAEEYDVHSLAVFGSYLRGDQSGSSDLDVLVSFEVNPGLLRYIELEQLLSDELGVKVDLVMRDALKPRIGERILRDAVPV